MLTRDQGTSEPPRRGHRPGEPNRLPIEKVDAMWVAYLRQPTIQHVVDATRVSRTAARRYVRRGDPTRGIVPFAKRLAEFEKVRRIRSDSEMLAASQTMAEAIYNKLVDDDGQVRRPTTASVKNFKLACDQELKLAAMQDRLAGDHGPEMAALFDKLILGGGRLNRKKA